MELDAEIFAVGKWNGMEFSAADLTNITDAFATLGDNMKVALKMGHNQEQPMTDGHPALGWVSKVWVAGDKLMARFTDLPKIVYEAIQKKLYKNVSIELDLEVKHKGNDYPLVLTGVALLGADIPAVSTLKDLTHYMGRSADFSAGCSMQFAAIAGTPQSGGNNMDLAQLTEAVNKLTFQVTELSTGKATADAANIVLTAKVKQFEAEDRAKTDAALTAKIALKRDDVKKLLEDGVKAMKITPAQRDTFSRMLCLDDDVAVEKLDVSDVSRFIASGASFSKPNASRTKQGVDNNESGDAEISATVAAGVRDILAKKEAPTHLAAQGLFFSRNPELARQYIDSTN